MMRRTRRVHPLSHTRLLLVGCILLGIYLAYAAATRDPEFRILADETIDVQLTPSDHPDQLVYEDPHVRISIGYDDFITYLNERVEAKEIPELRERQAEENALWQQEVDAQLRTERSYRLTYPEHEHKYFIAHMLESGRVRLSTSEGYTMSHIFVRTYAFTCGPLCGRGQRFFHLPRETLDFLPGFRFFAVQDWIS